MKEALVKVKLIRKLAVTKIESMTYIILNFDTMLKYWN